MNWQEIDIYVATGDGLFLYNAKANRLEPILAQDVRAATGTQDFVVTAPVDLIYVADLSKTGQSGSQAALFIGADVGFISENVYLLCTSEGLATVVRVPAPIAIPTSAVANAGASFTPSPTMATLFPPD